MAEGGREPGGNDPVTWAQLGAVLLTSVNHAFRSRDERIIALQRRVAELEAHPGFAAAVRRDVDSLVTLVCEFEARVARLEARPQCGDEP